MSHELYFYVDADDRPVKKGLFGPLKTEIADGYVSGEELLAFLHNHGHFKDLITPDGFNANYLNKHTGTTIEFRLHTNTIIDVESRYSFPGYNYTGLSVKIEYFRPAYFVHEAAAILEAMSKEFHMYLLDPQLSPLLKKCIGITIIRSWEESNEQAVLRALEAESRQLLTDGGRLATDGGRLATEGGRLATEGGKYAESRLVRPYMPKENVIAWWKYMYRKDELTAKIKESSVRVHVPEWKVIRRTGYNKLYLAMTLAEGIGYIIPPCDIFLVKRNKFSEVGAVEASVLLPKIKDYLRPWSYAGMHLYVLTSPDARRISRILREMPLEDIHRFEQIAPGSFLDVEALAGEDEDITHP